MPDLLSILPGLGIELAPLEADDPAAAGDIVLLGRLGEGGMGRVYLGATPAGRPVAVKMVKDPFAHDPVFRARFAREAAIAERVNAVFTAPVLSHESNAERPWLATAFIPGPTLAAAVIRHGVLPARGVWRLTAGIAEALKAIHAAGITHRDLKPGNVLLAADGPRVIDFGISRAEGDFGDFTQTGVRMGTPAYMSPEHLRGEPLGPPADVFALGSVIAFAASGVSPFDAASDAELMYRITQAEPDLSAVTDEGLRALIASCLAKDPALRPTPDDIITAFTRTRRNQVAADWLPAGLAASLATAAPATVGFGGPAVPVTGPAQEPSAEPSVAGLSNVDGAPPSVEPSAVDRPLAQSAAGLSNVDGPLPSAEPSVVDRPLAQSAAGLSNVDGALLSAEPSVVDRPRGRRRLAIVGVVAVVAVILTAGYLADFGRTPSQGVGAGSTPTAGGSRTESGQGASAGASPSTTTSSAGNASPAPSRSNGGPATGGSPTPGGKTPGAGQTPPLPSGTFKESDAVLVSVADGTVLSATGGVGSAVRTMPWSNSSSQHWRFEKAGDTGWFGYYVVSPKSALGKELASDASRAELAGANSLATWIYSKDTQRFQSTDAQYCLTANGSGKQATVEYCGAVDTRQQWKLVS